MNTMDKARIYFWLLTLVGQTCLCQETTTTGAHVSESITEQDEHVSTTTTAITVLPEVSGQEPDKRTDNRLHGELRRMLNLQFVCERRSEDISREWLADKDVASQELQASFMVHETLLSHVATVRCPVYLMLFSWFMDERRHQTRAQDPYRRVTRRILQMLSFRVAIEPEFYHDVFMMRRFGRFVQHIMHVVKHIETYSTHAEERETWYDLLGCLYDYGSMPMPHGPREPIRHELESFLNDDKRKRGIIGMVTSRGQRTRRLTGLDLIRLRGVCPSNSNYDQLSRVTVESMMDLETLNMLNDYRADRFSSWLARPAQAPYYPLWPPLPESIPPYDPTRDFRPMHTLLDRFLPNEIEFWAQNAREQPLDEPNSNEPYLARLAPRINLPTGFHRLARTRSQVLVDIAEYYHIRYKLITIFVDSVVDQRLNLWSKLPINSALEYNIITQLVPEVPSNEDNLRHIMATGLELYNSMCFDLEVISKQQNLDFSDYKTLLSTIRSTLDGLSSVFDVLRLYGLNAMMLNIVNMMERIRNIIPSIDEASTSTASDALVTQDEDCAVCLEALDAFIADENMNKREHYKRIELSCGHKFHWACMFEWFRRSAELGRRCPLCRSG